MERAIPNEDGTVEHLVWPGEGQPPISTVYDSAESYLEARAREEKAELWDQIRRPFRLVKDQMLGGEI